MFNDKFEVIHLKQRKFITPLFDSCTEAYSLCSEPRKNPATYLVIESKARMDQQIFKGSNICPVYIYGHKSYVFLEGECLWRYFLARKQSDNVLPEEQIWTMISQITSALMVLRQNGHEHRHIKQYAIRRISSDQFKLIYHPEIKTVGQIIQQKKDRWYKFYLAPEQLPPYLTNQQQNSCVFSLGALALNLMNPLDFLRDIYSQKEYSLNFQVIDSKMKNILSLYSSNMAETIKKMLQPDAKKRIKLNQLQKLLLLLNPIPKKMIIVNQIKPYVANKLGNSQEKKKKMIPEQSKEPFSNHNKTISLFRGTFGQQNSQKSLQFQRQTFGGPHSQASSNGYSKNNQTQGFSGSNQIDQSMDYSYENTIKYKQYLELLSEQKKQHEFIPEQNGHKQTPAKYSSVAVPNTHIQTSQKQNELSQQSFNVSDFSILKSNKQFDCIQEQLAGFKTKLKLHQLQLSRCLLPLNHLIDSMKVKGKRINQGTYYGQLQNGRRNGFGLQIFSDRQYYYGFFKQDLFHGEGFYFWNRTKYFLGVFENGFKKQGSWLGGGIKYIGQIKNSKRHGLGSCYYSNGRIYQGEWFQGKRHGSGILTEPSGQQFIGIFRNGRKFGKGSYLSESCRIIGSWDEDESMGQVQIIYDNGNYYKGRINKDFQKQGLGQFVFSSGSACKGNFSQDQFVNGQIRYRNGERYVGDTKGFQRDGIGIYYYNDGRVVEGQWREGTLLKQINY